MKRILASLLVLSIALSFGLVGCAETEDTGSTEPASESAEPAPEESVPAEAEGDPDRALVETKCSLCHTTDRVWSADYDQPTWEATLDRMKTNGMVITDEEYEQIVAYLSAQ